LATKQLAQLAARKAAKKVAEAAAPAMVKLKPATCPGAVNRDARAVARPGTCSAVAPARIAAQKNRVQETTCSRTSRTVSKSEVLAIADKRFDLPQRNSQAFKSV
jgi:hypothetical protein